MPAKKQDLSSFLNYLNAIEVLPDGLIKELLGSIKSRSVKKGKFIQSPIDRNECLYFNVNSGIVRGFIKEENKEITTWLSCDHEFFGATKNPRQNEIFSYEYLQAISDCQLITLPYACIHQLYLSYNIANVIGRKILRFEYYKAVERSILARIPSAEGRYKAFIKTGPDCLAQIPLRYLSSYLTMRVETLSRIRTKVNS